METSRFIEIQKEKTSMRLDREVRQLQEKFHQLEIKVGELSASQNDHLSKVLFLIASVENKIILERELNIKLINIMRNIKTIAETKKTKWLLDGVNWDDLFNQ